MRLNGIVRKKFIGVKRLPRRPANSPQIVRKVLEEINCLDCSSCCTGSIQFIPVSGESLAFINGKLEQEGTDPKQFLYPYSEGGDFVKEAKLIPVTDARACPFFDFQDQKRCTIYEHRPLCCELFPLIGVTSRNIANVDPSILQIPGIGNIVSGTVGLNTDCVVVEKLASLGITYINLRTDIDPEDPAFSLIVSSLQGLEKTTSWGVLTLSLGTEPREILPIVHEGQGIVKRKLRALSSRFLGK